MQFSNHVACIRLVISLPSTSPPAKSRCWADLLQGWAWGRFFFPPRSRWDLLSARSRDYDAMGPQTRFVQCPEGELQKRKEVGLKNGSKVEQNKSKNIDKYTVVYIDVFRLQTKTTSCQ